MCRWRRIAFVIGLLMLLALPVYFCGFKAFLIFMLFPLLPALMVFFFFLFTRWFANKERLMALTAPLIGILPVAIVYMLIVLFQLDPRVSEMKMEQHILNLVVTLFGGYFFIRLGWLVSFPIYSAIGKHHYRELRKRMGLPIGPDRRKR